MTAPKQLTRKVGPLPAWAWAAVVVGAYLAYRHYGGSGGSPTVQGTPVVPNVGSAAQQPSGGQGTPADNSSSDLLSALGANTQAADALLAAVQGAAAGGGLGVAAGTGTSGGSSSAAAAAASADAPPADTTTPAPDAAASPDTTPATPTTQSQTIPLPGIAYIETQTGIAPAPAAVSSPTPTVVQPAPVYTEGVIAQPGIAYAA